MNENEFSLEKAKEWFTKGYNDIRSAQILAKDADPPTDTLCYHCQQAVEKYLKGLLTLKKIDFIKTHDLSYLVKLSKSATGQIDDIEDDILSLNKYAIEARYPADIPIHYPIKEAKDSLKKATSILGFIKSLLPASIK